jgi:peptidoglycan/LPS O-acetylase OafA/YrhL
MTSLTQGAERVDVRFTGPVRGYLDQVDVVRLLTFGSVIMVHSIAATTAGEDAAARGSLMLLHFTRETFFVITGFVLFHSGYRRDLELPRFWRRRFLLIGVPYLVWSLIYFTWNGLHQPQGALHHGAGYAVHELWFQLLTGTAAYHLYFLLVSMQIYLVFGLLLWLVRRTEGHHGRLLAAVAAYQLLLFWLLHDVIPSWRGAPHWLGVLDGYAQQLLPSYLVYVVAGALVAVHIERAQAWVLRHGRLVVLAVVVGALLTEAVYLWQVGTGTRPSRASDVLQPVMVGWTLVLTTGLLAVGLRYALRATSGRPLPWVREGARISFGVFLVHVLVIDLLLLSPLGPVISGPGQPWLSVLLWLGTVVVSVVFAEIVSRTPLSLPLTGRRFEPRRPAPEGTPS